jgi:predicted amidophosphoribosyltransferase
MTKPQTQLRAHQRQANVAGAFVADSVIAAGKSLMLVDDVYTTGSTLQECSSVLRKAGALEVRALTIAQA